jgi:gamma-glutamyltranspeptidase/glutathione hydrolase
MSLILSVLPLQLRFRGLGVALLMALCASCAGEPPPSGSSPEAEDLVFPSQNRPDVRGTQGAVSADHPLAAAAGLDVLRRGGNAVDAAVAMAGVLAVARPHMNGVGGDVFALFYDGETEEVVGLNGSGRAGALATPEFFEGNFGGEIPNTGPGSVSVPGAVAAWADALDRFGTMELGELLQPAIRYAREGFPVSARLAEDFRTQGRSLNPPGRDLYLPGGSPPPVGSLLRNPALAETLERIARDGKAGFYQGPVAESLAAFLESEGGYLRTGDFAAHTTAWVDPLSGSYLGYRLLVMPPNSQGVAQLMLTEMAKHQPLEEMGQNTPSYLHTLIELKKLAFADRDRWVADPEYADIPLDRLLDPERLARRAELVDPRAAASEVEPGVTGEGSAAVGGPAEGADDFGDTVYLTAVDRWGNAVSWIQSLYSGFGSGLLEPETGVLLQNRGALFTMEKGHPNQVAPGKRPYHTLTPLVALREDGSLGFTLGTPGGDSQTQSLLQIMNNVLLFGMLPQEAIEAPRFRGYEGLEVAVEDRIPVEVQHALGALGHRLRVVHGWTATFGGAQMIFVDPVSGTLVVASDPRREAYGLAY